MESTTSLFCPSGPLGLSSLTLILFVSFAYKSLTMYCCNYIILKNLFSKCYNRKVSLCKAPFALDFLFFALHTLNS